MEKISRVYFRIYYSDFKPFEISEILGLVPSDSFQKGEIVRGFVEPKKFNYWSYQVLSREDVEAEQQISVLLDELEMLGGKLLKIKKNNVETVFVLGLAVYSKYYNLGFHFDLNILERIKMLGLELDLDIYFDEEF